MTLSSGMRQKHYHASAEQPQHYLGNRFSIPHPTSSYRGSSSPLPSIYVSPSHSKSSYTTYPTAKGYEMEDSSDVQRSSYCSSETRSRRGGNGMLQDDFTVTAGIHNSPAAEVGQDLAVPGYDNTENLPRQFGLPFTGPAIPCHSPCYGASFEERQPIEFSLNGYSSIGSQFKLDKAQGLVEDPFMDPLFSQYLPADVRHRLDSAAANQMSSENRLLPFSPNIYADESVPPAVLTTKGNANSLYCDVSVTGRAVLRTNTNPWLASTTDSFLTGYTTSSEHSSSFASAETTHLDEPSILSHPCYNASSAAPANHTSPYNSATLTGHPRNGTESRLKAVTGTSSNPIFAIYHLGQESSSSLASMETLKANPLQAIGYHRHDDLTDATNFRSLSSISPLSLMGLNLDFSKCLWAGCSTVKKGKNRKSNMRNHVRMTHEKPAPPICEICGKKYKQHESLKRHLSGQEHQFELSDPVRTVRKTSADGRVYTTYQQVHEYVKRRKTEMVGK